MATTGASIARTVVPTPAVSPVGNWRRPLAAPHFTSPAIFAASISNTAARSQPERKRAPSEILTVAKPGAGRQPTNSGGKPTAQIGQQSF